MRVAPLVASLVLSAFVIADVPASAQTPTVTLVGRVVDGTRPVPGAAVVAVSGVPVAETRTDDAGRFVLPLIPADAYEIRVTAPGFKSRRLTSLVLTPNARARVEVTLTAGNPGEWEAANATAVLLATGTSWTLTTDWLSHLPFERAAAIAAVPDAFPGIANGAAFGAAAGTSTTRRIDGIDVSDPLNGAAWTTFVLPAASQVSLAGPGQGVREGGYTGATIDVVSRAGGPTFSGLVDVLGTTDGLRADNLTEDLIAGNPLLASPDRVSRATDLAVVLGGPLRRDRASFSLAVGYGLMRVDPTGPRTDSRRTTPRVQGRLLVGSPAQLLTASVLADAPSADGLAPRDVEQTVPEGLGNRLDRRTVGSRVGWQRPLGDHLRVSVGYGLLWGRRTLTPAAQVPARFNSVDGTVNGSLGRVQEGTRQRHVISGLASWDLQAAGAHLVEAGAALEAGRVGERDGYVGNELFYDLGGRPNLVEEWAGIDRQARIRRVSVFAQDTWTPTSRVTLQAGIRGDRLRGSGASGGTLYSATSWQPRGGVAIDLTGTGRLLVRAHAGLYTDPLYAAHFDRAIGGDSPLVTLEILSNGARREVDRLTPPTIGVDRGVTHPGLREISGGADYRLTSVLTLGVTATARRFTDFIDAVFPDARWLAITRPGLEPGTVTIYRWFNRAASQGSGIITNVNGFAYLAANGLPLANAVAERRYTGIIAHGRADLWRHQATLLAAFAYAKADGTIDDTFAAGLNRSTRFASPSASLVNAAGTPSRTPEQELTLLGTSRVPKLPIRVSALYVAQFPPRYAAIRQFSSETLDFPFEAEGRQVRLEPMGIRTLPVVHELDLRIEYTLRLGGQRLTVYSDVRNAVNRAGVVESQERYPFIATGAGTILPFDAPLAVQAPRQIVVGGRWTF